MDHPGFFENAGPFSISAIADQIGATPVSTDLGDHMIEDIKPLDHAGPSHLSFFDNTKYLSQFVATNAGACIVSEAEAERDSSAQSLLITRSLSGFCQGD